MEKQRTVDACDMHCFVRHALDVVRHKYDGKLEILVQRTQKLVKIIAHMLLYACRRLIEKDDLRLCSKRSRDKNSLLLTAGKISYE